MTSAKFDVDGVDALVADLIQTGARCLADVKDDVAKSTKKITAGWRADAKKKAGSHGKHYPASIKPELVTEYEAVIGPLESMPQGGMGAGFEYGTPTVARKQSPNWVNPPMKGRNGWFGGPRIGQRVGQDVPQMSMNITADKEFPAFVVAVEKTMAKDWR